MGAVAFERVAREVGKMQSQIVPNQRGAFAVRFPLDDFTADSLQPDGGLPSSFADAAWCGFGASDFPKFLPTSNERTSRTWTTTLPTRSRWSVIWEYF